MPVSDGLVTADFCRAGSPGSPGDSAVFPNTRIPSHPLWPSLGVHWKREDARVLYFRLDKRGRLGPQGNTQMPQVGAGRTSFRINSILFLPVGTTMDLAPEYEVAPGTEQKALVNIVGVEKFCLCDEMVGIST